MCEDDVKTKDFGIYFKNYYSQRPKAWAFCYRLGLFLNTNIYLEAMHKKLKYCYMHGKQISNRFLLEYFSQVEDKLKYNYTYLYYV
jgi:hypothetical protein